MVDFETLSLLVEVRAVREAIWTAQHASAERREEELFWICCVFPGENLCLLDGQPVDEVVKAMLCKKENATVPYAIGINCTKTRKVAQLLVMFEQAIEKLLDAKEIESGQHWYCIRMVRKGRCTILPLVSGKAKRRFR